MKLHRLHLIGCLGASLLAGPAFAADCPGGCAAPDGPKVIYGPAPAIVDLPPVGYVLDPSDARKPIYIVNQGPVYSGPLIYSFAVPTYSEGGYAYAVPYPYVRVYDGWHRWRYNDRYYPAKRWRRSDLYRPYAAAYAYRPAPSARVIEVPER
jgi:hypothetical protein